MVQSSWGVSGALGGPGFHWWARYTYIFTDVFFGMLWRVSMCIEQGPSLPLYNSESGGVGLHFLLGNIGCSLGNFCLGSANVQYDFLVSLVGVVFRCPGGLLLLWMMSYVCILLAI